MGKPIRVLLVDDEERFNLNLAKLLRCRGFQVESAFNGESGVAAVRQGNGFHVVILDVKMPVMDGIEALRLIKDSSPDTEVLMLTGHADVETGIKAMREGALDYLIKPCDIEELVAKILEAQELENIRLHPVLWPRHLVKEITWPSFIRLETDDPISKALSVFMQEEGMRIQDELFIVDSENHFKGIVSRRDLLDAARGNMPGVVIHWSDLTNHPEWLPAAPLHTIMRSGHPVIADPETDLEKAALQMLMGNLRCMPVVEIDRVTGVVRLNDILKHLGR